jgi:hypothetical protein
MPVWITREAPVVMDEPFYDEAEAETLRRQYRAKQAAKANGAASWKEPDPDYVREKLSFEGWIARDIPPLDRLLGDFLTTTSRVLLVAPTGIGKTNLCLAVAVAIAIGRDFLHWHCAGPRRVLYIDGEMSDRLMKARIIDAARRAGETRGAVASLEANLKIVNRADFPDMAPLDTEAGQKFVNCLIKIEGPFALVIFDNIQALQIGDMKDEAPWQQTLPWIRNLTARRIGQLWVHHTGHDETHSYGTKTREWQLDTVALLEQIERPEADIAFSLKFTKARERTPENRAEFEPAIITLAGDAWSSERGGNIRKRRTGKDRVFELLVDAIARHGEIPPANEGIPPDTPCVTEKLWRLACERGCISEGSSDATRMAFNRAAKVLVGSRVGKCGSWIWII